MLFGKSCWSILRRISKSFASGFFSYFVLPIRYAIKLGTRLGACTVLPVALSSFVVYAAPGSFWSARPCRGGRGNYFLSAWISFSRPHPENLLLRRIQGS